MSASETSETTGLRGAAAQLARLTHQRLEPAEFYQQFLDLLPAPPTTLGSAAWSKRGNVLRSIARGSRNPPQGLHLPYTNDQHAEILGRVATSSTWEIVAPRRSTEFHTLGENGSPAMAVFPIARQDDDAYLIEVFLPNNLDQAELRQFALQTELLCSIGAAYHHADALRRTTDPAPVAGSPFAREVHRSLNVTETCFALANEGRAAIGCDRATVLVRRGTRYKVRAVSSQDEAHPRANLIQSLQSLVERTMAIGEPFWYPAPEASLAPEVEKVLEHYVELSLCRTLGILPLCPAPPRVSDASEPNPSPGEPSVAQPVGALVVEQFAADEAGREALQLRAEAVAEQGGIALGHAVAHERIFLLPLWKRLGALRSFLFGSRRGATLTVAALLVALILALFLVPAELKVTSEGRLQPLHRRNVFANWDGTIVALHVEHGQEVAEGTPLVAMRNEIIELEIRRLQGEIATHQGRLEAVRAQRLSNPAPSGEATSAQDDSVLEQQDLERVLESLQAQLAIQLEREQQLVVTSPLDGHVLTWNLEELLQDRPVERGQFLMELADLSGPWCLELDVPDRRTMHVLRAAAKRSKPLDVTFLLASDPKRRHSGQELEITRGTNMDPETGPYLRMTVGVDGASLPFRQPGTKVQAKIHCGKHRLGYVWFHQLWEFLQSRVLFRIR